MEIRRFVSNLMFSNMYVLVEDGHALIIDPFERLDVLDGLKPDLILLTHEHYDHISGVNSLKERYGIPLMCSAECNINAQNPKTNSARYFESFSQMQSYGEQDPNVPIDETYGCSAELTFDDEIVFYWQGHRMWMFALPGHSKGGTGIVVDDQYFFSGDSLLPDRNTELRFPGGSKRDWNNISLSRLNDLPDDLVVYPGHRDMFLMKDRRNNGII